MIYFHATFSVCLDSIRRKGLLANPPRRAFDWSEVGVYLGTDKESCIAVAECAEEEWAEDCEKIVVLEIDGTLLNTNLIEADTHDRESNQNWILYRGDIPASAIKFP